MDRKAWIVVTLCSIGLVLNFWLASKNQPLPAPATTPAAATQSATGSASVDSASTTPGAAANAGNSAATIAAADANLPEETHTLTQGSVTYHFTTNGGGVAKAVLAGHDQVVLNELGKEAIGALRREANGRDPVAYRIVEKSDKSVAFEGTNAEGIKIRKVYSLTEGDKSDEHLLSLTVSLTNTGTSAFRSEEIYMYAGAAHALRPDETPHPRFFWNDYGDADFHDTGYFSGGWFSKEKVEFTQHFAHLQYAGVMSRFYLHLINHKLPEGVQGKPGRLWATRFYVDHKNDRFKDTRAGLNDFGIQAAMSMPPVELAPGATQTENYEIYTGPKEYRRLHRLEEQRDFVMFYGWFKLISKGLTSMMSKLHEWTGNWGVAIVILTLIVRTLIWPIHAKSQYTMKRMSLLAPKMKELQEKYKDDPQRQQMEVMKLYKEYGVNPLGGCLPMLLQIPIFFGFYRVLENAAELRGQPFFGWIHDLSLPDTVGQVFGLDINPLPIIMGITMILQMKLTPQPATQDKTQKIMFTIMPFFFLFICYNFAAALALYWSTQNIFSIFQSWIMKLYMKEPTLEKVKRVSPTAPAANDSKKSKNRPPKLGG